MSATFKSSKLGIKNLGEAALTLTREHLRHHMRNSYVDRIESILRDSLGMYRASESFYQWREMGRGT